MTSPFVPGPALRIAGAPRGPLAGLTFAAKDLFDVAGHPTGGGNPDWARQHPVPTRHAWAVQRLLDAGATLIGKTVTDEVSLGILGENPFDGTPLNPKAPDRVPGGSSSGSASAVAQGLCDVALGTDPGGSVRVPASFCGLYGIRPTHGRLDLTGMRAQAPSSDRTGWSAPEGRTFARGSEAVRGEPIPASLPTRLVVAVDAFGSADAETGAALGPMVRKLSALVKEVREALLAPRGLSVWARAQRTLQPYEAWLTFKDWIDRDNPRFAFSVARTLVLASTIPESERQWAAMMRAEACARLAWLLPPGTILCMPTTPFPAPPKGLSLATLEPLRARIGCLASQGGLLHPRGRRSGGRDLVDRAGRILARGGDPRGPHRTAPGHARRGLRARQCVCPGEPDRFALVALPGDGGTGRSRGVRGELDTERGADRAVVHRAARQHDGSGVLGHGGGRAGDRPARAVADHRVWLARRLSRPRPGHAHRARSARLPGCAGGADGGRAGSRRRVGTHPPTHRRGPGGRRRPADAGVLGALLRLPVHAAGRLLGRHPSGGLRRGPWLPTPVRGRHLRAHRFALDRRPDRVRRRGRPDRAHDLGDHLLRLHGGGNALPARTRGVAARGRPLRLRAFLRPRLRRSWPHHHRDGVAALSGATLRRHLRHAERGQRHRRWHPALVRRRRARPDRPLSPRLSHRGRGFRAGRGVLSAPAPPPSPPLQRPPAGPFPAAPRPGNNPFSAFPRA